LASKHFLEVIMPDESSSLTLRSYFERFHARLFLADARPATFQQYRYSLNKWERLTSNPVLLDVGNQTLAEFKAALVGLAMSASTVNKHLRHVQAMLNKAGPSGPHNRDALGLIAACPWTKTLRTPRPRPRAITADVLRRVYEACKFALLPARVGAVGERDLFGDLVEQPELGFACDWWRALIVCAYNLGLRRSTLLSLIWSDVDVGLRVVSVLAENDKCGEHRVKPLNDFVVRHLLVIRLVHGDRVFAWPHTERTFYRQWHAILDGADVPTAEHFGLHDLKRTCGSVLARTASPWAVQKMLDHASIETSKHYVDATAELRSAVDSMPQPW
jgi:integrase